jgi:hypothetical protein
MLFILIYLDAGFLLFVSSTPKYWITAHTSVRISSHTDSDQQIGNELCTGSSSTDLLSSESSIHSDLPELSPYWPWCSSTYYSNLLLDRENSDLHVMDIHPTLWPRKLSDSWGIRFQFRHQDNFHTCHHTDIQINEHDRGYSSPVWSSKALSKTATSWSKIIFIFLQTSHDSDLFRFVIAVIHASVPHY